MALTTGENCNRNFMRFGSGKHEQHMGGWFFQRLQQSVEGGHTEHVNLVDDVDFKSAVSGHIFDIFPQFAHLIDAVIGRTIDFINVGAMSAGNLLAGSANITRNSGWPLLAIHCLGQYSCNSSFACAARTGKQDCMGDSIRRDRIGQRSGDMSLFDNLVKVLRTVLACKNKIGHKEVPKNINA